MTETYNSQASLKVLQVLIETDPASVETANNVGFWPLHEACCNDAPLDVALSLVELSPSAFKWGWPLQMAFDLVAPMDADALFSHH
jgi:hypothetical protein